MLALAHNSARFGAGTTSELVRPAALAGGADADELYLCGGEGAAALLAVAKAVGEGGTLYCSPTRLRWRWHMQPAQPPTRSCLIRIWMASRLCPLSCVAGAQEVKIQGPQGWQGSTKGRRQCWSKAMLQKYSGVITRFFVSQFMYPLILSV